MRIALTVLVCLAACGGESGTGPDPVSLAGTWTGTYTTTSRPDTVFQAVLQLAQTGSDVTGTLTTDTGRSADVVGAVGNDHFDAIFTYTDECLGTASTTADVVDGGGRLTGNYSSTDCLGETSGGYVLERQ